jgi:prolyl-tRNA editing enzyme YbaK/EbsC (Cys-tRNA(Pro) deacylase)
MRQKVIDTARELGLEVDVRRLPGTTATVGDAARAVGCDEAEIAKSLVFVADGDPVLCIASGSHRVDPGLLAEALDVAEVRQATPDEVRAATGFSVGGVPPFGHDLPVVFDESLLDHDRVYAAGGDGHSLFEVDPRKLLDCTGASAARVSAERG